MLIYNTIFTCDDVRSMKGITGEVETGNPFGALEFSSGFVRFALLNQYKCALYNTVSPISVFVVLVIALSILLRFTTFNYPFVS